MPTSYEIDCPPFPALAWADDFWEGFAPRPAAWKDLRVDSERALRGGAEHGVTVYRSEHLEPSPEQRAAYQAFLDGGDALVSLVLAAVHEHYASMRPKWLKSAPDLDLPVIATPGELVRKTQLAVVYVHEVVSAGTAYLGIALRSEWDPEHGAGVMLHGTRVVDVGGHDHAMLAWIAKKDAKARKPKKP